MHDASSVYHQPLAACLDEAIHQLYPHKPKDEIKIIDAAAGTGLMGVELQKLGYTSLCALDISDGMLNEANKKNVYKKFICAALTDQEIPEIQTGEFDALICGGSMFKGHIRSSALTEMVRIVDTGKSALGIVRMCLFFSFSFSLYAACQPRLVPYTVVFIKYDAQNISFCSLP